MRVQFLHTDYGACSRAPPTEEGRHEMSSKLKPPVAQAVFHARKRTGMSREELAKAMRRQGHAWTYDVVASVENGRRRVDTTEVASLSAIQGLPPNAYVHGLELVPAGPGSGRTATLPEASSGSDAIPGKLYQLSNHLPPTPAELIQRPEAA